MTNFIVNSLEDTVVEDGKVTLREAIEAANTNTPVGDAPAGRSGADTINFDLKSGSNTINLDPDNGTLNITDDLQIDGPGADDLIVSGQLAPREADIDIFSIENAKVKIQGLTIDQSPRDGIRSDGGGINLTLKDSIVRNNDSDAVDLQGEGNNTVRVINSELLYNRDGLEFGGANNSVIVRGSTFNGNQSNALTFDGTGNDVKVTDSTFNGNSDGLEIDGDLNIVTVNDSEFIRNDEDGLEIDGDFNIVTVNDSKFLGNGEVGIEFDGTENNLTVTKSIFSENESEAIFFDTKSKKNILKVFYSTIKNNGKNPDPLEAPSVGGGIGINGKENTVEVVGSDIIGNMGILVGDDLGSGGGAGIRNAGMDNTVTVKKSKIADNTTDGNGGGIFNNGILSVINSQIIDNTADIAGGAIFNDVKGTLSLFRSEVFGNMPNNIVTLAHF